MKAIVLAAGRGERMRPLTDHTPKPLLEVHGTPLIEWHLQALARGGVREVVVNTAWLEEQIVARLGDGQRFGLQVRYALEGHDHGGALETAGGLKNALPLLAPEGETPFWYVAADVFAPDFDFASEARTPVPDGAWLAHLWMVPNPPQHPTGDFSVEHGLATTARPGASYTWSGIGLFRAGFVTELMAGLRAGEKARLRPYLDLAIAQGRLGATIWDGDWADVGTPQRLQALNETSRESDRSAAPNARS